LQATLTAAKLQITKKDLAGSQLLSVQQAMQLNQQGQQLADTNTRCKQLEQQLLEAQQQVSRLVLTLAAHMRHRHGWQPLGTRPFGSSAFSLYVLCPLPFIHT
jgi:hypothetical protein